MSTPFITDTPNSVMNPTADETDSSVWVTNSAKMPPTTANGMSSSTTIAGSALRNVMNSRKKISSTDTGTMT